MAISIRRKTIEEKARRVALRHGTTMTDAIELGLDTVIAQDDADYAKFSARIKVIQDAVALLPDTGLSEQDIMGWDENGLPT